MTHRSDHTLAAPISSSSRSSQILNVWLISVLLLCLTVCAQVQGAEPKKIVLIAGPKSHGPVGNGIHDYPWSVKLLKVMLDQSNIADQVRVEYHLDGWPEDPRTLDDADTIMVISDGRDGELYEEAPHFKSPENQAIIARQMDRGCGFLTFHFSTFAPDSAAEQILNWSGAYFDWETDGQRKWYSAITQANADVIPTAPDHPVLRGVKPFKMQEEFYFNLQFKEGDKLVQPLLMVPSLPGREPDGRVVAWARQRENGGRGFGTTCGHFYENWKRDDFRRMILNALAWTAHVSVPEQGVQSRYFTHEEITRAITGINGTERAVVDDRPIRALILSGEHHPGHHWKETSPVLKASLERDPRMQVEIAEDPEILADPCIRDYDLLIQNYCNWRSPGLSESAKQGFIDYLNNGGGLVIVHFANGAFHFSLPESKDSDWPEYRHICRRVWDHTRGLSGHDAYGKFTVEIDDSEHPVTRGLEPFQTTDELYFRQQGTDPIHVLASARSSVTGQFEPMAFTYEYGKGRVFQTVLGHSVESLQTPGTSELIRRAGAWVAGRKQVPALSPSQQAAPAGGPAVPLTKGRFGQGLDAKQSGAFVSPHKEYAQLPLTVECWAKLEKHDSYNILVANEDKSSGTHWELFTMAGSGTLSAYLPGQTPDHVLSRVNICDSQWHHLALTYAPDRVCLYVDGRQVAEQRIESKNKPSRPGPLSIGRLAVNEMNCSGSVDDVRISKGIREIALPTEPHPLDDQTIGLWRFDQLQESGSIQDESTLQNVARASRPVALSANGRPKVEGHWGEDALGFRWTEEDSVDNRWNQSNIGNFLGSVIPIPNQHPVAKGLSIKVGDQQEATVCFDTERVELRGAWTGGFLKFSPARYGIIEPPKIAGKLVHSSLASKQEVTGTTQYKGMRVHDNRVVLLSRQQEVEIAESPWIESHSDQLAITRTMQISPATTPVAITARTWSLPAEIRNIHGIDVAIYNDNNQLTVIAAQGGTPHALQIRDGNCVIVEVPASSSSQVIKLLYWSGPADQLEQGIALFKASPAPAPLNELLQPGSQHWPERIETVGTIGSGSGAYVLDTFTLPFNNPYKALMFVSGHDFLSNGDMMFCTVHGDVWRLSGIDDKLEKLVWKRYATGLFQPLGLKIINDEIFVLGRDQITRLHDTNHDNEADYYECFYNRYLSSPGGHDYVACLETDTEGNFYFVHANLGVVQVHRDASGHEVLATGLRNPNGMSVGPDNTITATPQEGEWTPTSAIYEVRRGHHYGYQGPKVTAERPLGYDPPLCWIPRIIDNSTGNQVWATDKRWGPLYGQLLSLSFGKCHLGLVLREHVDGVAQGGYVDLPLDFDSGVMRGRFSPFDGQLYVTGLRGWVSSTVLDGCIQRVRYTGAPIDIPLKVQTMQNGLAITFSRSLDSTGASDPDNFQVQQWNYLYSASYGSAEYRVSKQLEEGRDNVEVLSATLLKDGKTVFLEIKDLKPVMQMGINCSLRAADGTEFKQTLSYTINKVGPEIQDAATLTRNVAENQLSPEVTDHLKPGLIAQFTQESQQDTRTLRLPALYASPGTPLGIGLRSGTTDVHLTGYLQVPLKGTYQIRLVGRGQGQLFINGGIVCTLDKESSTSRHGQVHLLRGHNLFELRYQSPAEGAAELQVLWQGTDFAEEPIPPALFQYDDRHPELAHGQQLREGRKLFVTKHCQSCHQSPFDSAAIATAMLELNSDVPDLRQAHQRLRADWVYNWILDPQAIRNHASMPLLLDRNDETHRQAAADIASWLTAGTSPISASVPAQSDLHSAGEELFSTLGCYACHRFTPAAEADEFQRISLHFAAAKFLPGSLEEFLRNPAAHYQWTPMPDFRLSDEEAQALAAYIQASSTGSFEKPQVPHQPDPQRGRAAFQSYGCQQCHQHGAPLEQQKKLTSLFAISTFNGCLAEKPDFSEKVPHYRFTPAQRAALTSLLQTGPRILTEDPEAEAGARLISSLHCRACHSRDEQQSPRTAIYLEEYDTGFLPESLPVLTWTGEKLNPDWMIRLLSGEVPQKPRESLKARMPAFRAYASALATGLAAEHGHGVIVPKHQFNPALAQIGQALTLKDTGLDCRQCHAIGRDQPVGDGRTQIAPGINFALTRDRVRHDYYSRFVLDPPRFDVTTKMPKLAMDGRTTKIKSHFNGNAAEQFEAIWHYIQSVDFNSSIEK